MDSRVSTCTLLVAPRLLWHASQLLERCMISDTIKKVTTHPLTRDWKVLVKGKLEFLFWFTDTCAHAVLLREAVSLASFHMQDSNRLKLFPWRWCAPETMKSNGAIFNKQTDVWMLGVAFWYVCFCQSFYKVYQRSMLVYFLTSNHGQSRTVNCTICFGDAECYCTCDETCIIVRCWYLFVIQPASGCQ